MRLLRLEGGTSIYVLERKVGNTWKLLFVDPILMVGSGVFEDINWDDSSLWAPFSVNSVSYKKYGVPGTADLQAAVRAYDHLARHLAQGQSVRLRQVTITISSETLRIDGEDTPKLQELASQLSPKAKSKRRKRRKRKATNNDERPRSTWASSRSKHGRTSSAT